MSFVLKKKRDKNMSIDENKQMLQATWEMLEQLLETDNIQESLSSGLLAVQRYLKCESGAVWIYNEENQRLYPIFSIGEADMEGISIESGNGIEGKVLKTQKTIVIEDATAIEGFEGTAFDDQGVFTKNLVCVPIKTLDKTYGCVILTNKERNKQFTANEVKLLERFASIAAMNIEEKDFKVTEPETKEVLVSLENVTKEYHNPGFITKVLKGINLKVYKGEFLVVLGESGCGKSTMMNIIGGMDDLTDGKLIIDGKDYSHPTDKELTLYRRNYVGFIFQSYNLMPNLSAIENIKFIAEICKEPLNPKEALALVGLSDKADSYPSHMSGGQQQRVAIARALVKNPKLILADEPTAALDYETSIEVLSAIEKIVHEKQTTVIMITHNPEIGKMADRVVKLRNGRVFSIKRNLKPLKAKELQW